MKNNHIPNEADYCFAPIYGTIFQTTPLEDGLCLLLAFPREVEPSPFFISWRTIDENGRTAEDFRPFKKLYYEPATGFLDLV